MKAMEYKDYLQRFLDKLGIKALNEMQQEAYKAIKDTSKDIVILSPTGTGKTLAYLLPILEKIDLSSDSVQVIVVVPSRELAIQTTEILKRALNQVRAYACYGGRATMDEHREINKLKPQIIFGTPGRLNDHIDKHNFEIDNVRTLVIDEFDKCLKVGFRKEMTILVDSLSFVRRRILLSATNSSDLYLFARKNNTQEVLFLDEDNQPTDRIEPYYITSTSKDKLETLSTLLKSLGNESSIVFLNHRESVDRVYEYLSKEGFCVSALHGGFEQKQREAALFLFSNKSNNILVSTDLASRGLDIADVNNIINYHLPDTEDTFIHRIGRTARWNNVGKYFFILSPEEAIPTYVNDSPALFECEETKSLAPQSTMATLYIGKGKKDKISKGDILGFLCKKGNLDKEDVGRIDVGERYCYVAISRQKIDALVAMLKNEKIKGLKTIVERIK